MRYLSVCSGIEAATVAWHPLGWQPAAFSEIEKFPRAVLAHHYPDTPCHGDFTTIGADDYGAIDLLVGGTPCQSFSVAGLRGGLADDRGNLALQFLKLADRKRARWLVWENVPGVLSSNGGRDFGSILGGMVELGYGLAYRVLDAQHFGVPQRRRRVFVVGYLGDWRRAASVLFERHSLSGDTPPRREKGQGIANAITERPDRGGGNSEGQRLISLDVVPSMTTRTGTGRDGMDEYCVAHSLRGEDFDASEDGTGRGTPLVPVCRDVAASLTSNYGKQPDSSDTALGPNLVCFTAKDHGADASDISPTLRSGSHSGSHANGGVMPAVAIPYDFFQITAPINRQNRKDGDPCRTLAKDNASFATIQTSSAVRRLTPRECERLQGFPDDYTLIPYRGKQAADGPRYKALGNSMAVPVMSWIGERIALVEQVCAERLAA
jgi:DNA (cytosine-5)-methyltransferase 1